MFVFYNKIFNIAKFIGYVADDFQKKRMKFLKVPIFKKLTRYTNMNDPIFYLYNKAIMEPCVEICGGY